MSNLVCLYIIDRVGTRNSDSVLDTDTGTELHDAATEGVVAREYLTLGQKYLTLGQKHQM